MGVALFSYVDVHLNVRFRSSWMIDMMGYRR